MRFRTSVSAVIVTSLLWSSSAMAQQAHIVNPPQMRQALADQAATDQRNRDAVLNVLRTPQASEVAGRLGLNVTRAEDAVSTLNSTDLASLADQARTAEGQLVGGASNVVISTTTLLLIIIVVILVAR